MQARATWILLGILTVLTGALSILDELQGRQNYLQLASQRLLALRALEKTCQQYPDVTPCSFINSLDESNEGPEGVAGQRNKRSTSDREEFKMNVVKRQAEAYSPRYLKAIDLHEDMLPRVGKRYEEFRSRGANNEGSYKRGPGFRSWGGKRAKFSSWGGKRNEQARGNRFSNWGGKRSGELFKIEQQEGLGGENKKEVPEMGEKNEEAMLVLNKNKFDGWTKGGNEEVKETSAEWDGKDSKDGELKIDKRKFVSWGGKRTMTEEEKRKFVSWGGKRSENQKLMDTDKVNLSTWGDRQVFDLNGRDLAMRQNFWGDNEDTDIQTGKQFPIKKAVHLPVDSMPDYVLTQGGLSRFINWGGKRKFSSWGGKRSELQQQLGQQYYHSWTGNRDNLGRPNFHTGAMEGEESDAGRDKRSAQVMGQRLNTFAWGGHR